MFRLALAVVLAAPAGAALADACSVSGTVYDVHGKPLRAVVRLIDVQTGVAAFSATDANAAFVFNTSLPAGSGHYRIDLISPPTVVTGTHVPTRSILGMSDSFACGAGQLAHQDVHAQVD